MKKLALLLPLLLCACGGAGEEPQDSGNVPLESPPPVEWRKPPTDPCLNTYPCQVEAKK